VDGNGAGVGKCGLFWGIGCGFVEVEILSRSINTMRGTERGAYGSVRYFYQYKEGGKKYYYQKDEHHAIRMPFQKTYQRRAQEPPKQERHEYHEYIPEHEKPKRTNIEIEFERMNPAIRTLISTWLLVMGFQSINDISPDEVNRAFRKLSLLHHPDRGGNEENYKVLSKVRDHLLTLCQMAESIKE
jgi:hypothetical protein